MNFVDENIGAITSDLVHKETKKDLILNKVYKIIFKGNWPDVVDKNLMNFKKKEFELRIENGCIMWGHRLVIPSSLQPLLLNELHEAHMGIVRMKALARSYVWWPNIDRDIEEITKNCKFCLENSNNPPKAQLHVWDWPGAPNERIHADFLGPLNGDMYIIIVDAYSKWVEIRPMRNITSESTIEIFQDYICSWGIPFKLVTDNGPSFTSELFEEFCRNNGIHHYLTAPYHPA